MHKREKMLLMATLLIAAVFVGGLAWQRYVVEPLATLDRQTAARLRELDELDELRQQSLWAQQRLREIAGRTYDGDVGRAQAALSGRVAELMRQAELDPRRWTIRPMQPRRMRGGQQIGLTLQGEGRLERVVDLLHLLDREPVVGRVEDLSVRRGGEAGQVSVRLRYVSVVVEAVEAEQRVALGEVEAGGAGRLAYAGITERDLLRPYVPRPPEPEPEPERRERRPEPEPEPDPPPGPETYRVVSLTQWGGEPEVHVWDTNEDRTLVYGVGQELGDRVQGVVQGRIVLVDYRAMPLPTNPSLQSYSRVIVEREDGYWAIESGQTLAQKHRLSEEQLPSALRGEGRVGQEARTAEAGEEVSP